MDDVVALHADLAGSIGAQETKDFSRLGGEGHTSHRRHFAELLAQAADLDHSSSHVIFCG